MGAGRKVQNFYLDERAPSSPNQSTGHASSRNLRKIHLGGVIFGCKNNTMKECLSKQLFGLPAQHFLYVKNIDPGLPLFLFNYSDRKLHGIFEAASPGRMNINPYGWTCNGSERTQYPAQVQIHVRVQCQPLLEDQFKPIIADNYYSRNHFWFELDHAQASKLMSLLSSLAVAPGTSLPQNTAKRSPFQALPSSGKREMVEAFSPYASEVDSSHLDESYGNLRSCTALDLGRESNTLQVHSDEHAVENDEKDLVYMKLKELALSREQLDSPLMCNVEDSSTINDANLDDGVILDAQAVSGEKNERSSDSSSDFPSIITQLIQGMEELKAFNAEQIQKMGFLEHKLAEAEIEIQLLKDRCMILESFSNPSMTHLDEEMFGTTKEVHFDADELIFLVGGYDGESWLSSLNSYVPSRDVIKSLRPMNSVRSYASVAKLNGELYVFGGGNGHLWYDSVESYSPADDQWTIRPPLNEKKGSLAGVAVDNKIFAIGGGNGVECFSDVEMFDSDLGRWIRTRSMLQKRFALAASELNGVLYAVGGYDGKDYLKSAERFDPREHSWTKIGSMNTKRGCHSVAVFNEKLYALGGFDGSAMVASVEIFDPRLGSWMTGDPMNQPRGYSGAAVVKESIYVIGGVKDGDKIADVVEHYGEGKGWEISNLRAIGKRCFFSAIVL